ncbi:hypothetical protein [Candidatus Phytoplasma melaleucae]|uniref:SAP11 effector protein n=1 Tax=Candidatus Phytoplasma melaleucae TaxID=2982630 RepID=A0ABT9DEN8_9MOLU|nr:hypothetical protein ['Melaleuca sp.' phytoplasma]MDO8168259.1 hypothetical protein ['Melaleuca sp.' phytoplasma]
MLKIKNQFKTIIINFLILILLLFSSFNTVMAGPKKEKNTKKPMKTEKKVTLREYHQLERALDNLTEEERNSIIRTLNNPDNVALLRQSIANEREQKARNDNNDNKNEESSSSNPKNS